MSKINAIGDMIEDSGMNFGSIIKNVFFSYLLSIVLLAIFAVVLTYTNFPESSIPTAVLIISIIGILFGAELSAKHAKNRGWLIGGSSGLLYMLILYLLSLLINNNPAFDGHVLFMLLVGFLTGAVGGIIGINLKKPEKRYK